MTDLQETTNGNVVACLILLVLLLTGVAVEVLVSNRMEHKLDLICEAIPECAAQTERGK